MSDNALFPSTFRRIEAPLANLCFHNVGTPYGWGIYLGTLALTPITIILDIALGIFSLVALGGGGKLTGERFWSISHDHFFSYPLQQITFIIFSLGGTFAHIDYRSGYFVGQHGVKVVVNDWFEGRPTIFNRRIQYQEPFQPFDRITLSEPERKNVEKLVQEAFLFREYQKKLPEGHFLKGKKEVWAVFYDKEPESICDIEVKSFEADKKAKELGIDVERARDCVAAAREAITAYFALSYRIRLRLK